MLNAANELTVSVLQSARHTRNMLIVDDDQLAAEVAKEIKRLIEDSAEKVDHGTLLVGEAPARRWASWSARCSRSAA